MKKLISMLISAGLAAGSILGSVPAGVFAQEETAPADTYDPVAGTVMTTAATTTVTYAPIAGTVVTATTTAETFETAYETTTVATTADPMETYVPVTVDAEAWISDIYGFGQDWYRGEAPDLSKWQMCITYELDGNTYGHYPEGMEFGIPADSADYSRLWDIDLDAVDTSRNGYYWLTVKTNPGETFTSRDQYGNTYNFTMKEHSFQKYVTVIDKPAPSMSITAYPGEYLDTDTPTVLIGGNATADLTGLTLSAEPEGIVEFGACKEHMTLPNTYEQTLSFLGPGTVTIKAETASGLTAEQQLLIKDGHFYMNGLTGYQGSEWEAVLHNDYGTDVTYTIGDESIAKITKVYTDESWYPDAELIDIAFLTPGTTTLTAVDTEGHTASCEITVEEWYGTTVVWTTAPAESTTEPIRTSTAATTEQDNSFVLYDVYGVEGQSISAFLENAYRTDVTYTIEDESIAKIYKIHGSDDMDEGTIDLDLLAPGQTVLTATDSEGHTASCTIYVMEMTGTTSFGTTEPAYGTTETVTTTAAPAALIRIDEDTPMPEVIRGGERITVKYSTNSVTSVTVSEDSAIEIEDASFDPVTGTGQFTLYNPVNTHDYRQSVTLTLILTEENGNEVEKYYPIEVLSPGVTDCKLELWLHNTTPDKVTYQTGEALDLTGGVYDVYATFRYTDGHTEYYDHMDRKMTDGNCTYGDAGYQVIVEIDTSAFDSNNPGTYPIVIRVTCADKTVSQSFDVKVVGEPIAATTTETTATTTDIAGTAVTTATTATTQEITPETTTTADAETGTLPQTGMPWARPVAGMAVLLTVGGSVLLLKRRDG